MSCLFASRLFALGVVAFAVAACGQQEVRQAPVRAVQLITIGSSAAAENGFTYSGEVRAQSESLLGFQVGGKLKSRPVDIGQRVQAGDLLASLDSSDYQLSAASAKAQRDAAQSQLALATADLARYKDLAAKGFVGEAQLQRYQASYNAAVAQLSSAAAGASVQGNQLAYTQLRAPSAGVITGAEGELGQVVGAGAVVVRLAHSGPREVQFAVPQQRLTSVAPGQTVQVTSLASSATSSGNVVDVAASADPVTRSYLVRVRLAADAQWPLGSTAQVHVATKDADTSGGEAELATTKLPSTAVWLDGATSAVWVLEPQAMTVLAKPVQVVQVLDDGLLVSGLQQGDEVVSAGAHALTPGQVVKRFIN
ncbi:efflux RND transporter periplasmic adaptor subunit [Comamonadaceae bacterium M7527]|nr:efflux RND transporter periplasmic adaptor subunit [Comamonadaceae bacterium M7527]